MINNSIEVAYSFTPSSCSFKVTSSQIYQHCSIRTKSNRKVGTKLYSSTPIDDDIQNQLAKARKLLELTKAKVAAAAAAAAEEEAQQQITDSSVTGKEDGKESNNEKSNRKSVIKSTNEKTGLITTDGELMAALSEEEDWEIKSLMDVFESESENGRHDNIEDGLASRDVAASIFNLRMKMKDTDYKRIFDKRNRFIGEDN